MLSLQLAPPPGIEWHALPATSEREHARVEASGRGLRELKSDSNTATFGCALDASADLNGDGICELVVGGPSLGWPDDDASLHSSRTRAAVHSGASLFPLVVTSDTADERVRRNTGLGAAVLGIAGDEQRRALCVVGRRLGHDNEGQNADCAPSCGAEVLDLVAARPIRLLQPELRSRGATGAALASVRDGSRRVVALGAAERAGPGAVYFFDVDSGELLRRVEGSADEEFFGCALATSSANSATGVLAVASCTRNGKELRVSLFQGDGSVLARPAFVVPIDGRARSARLACLGNLDGDGSPDWALGAPQLAGPGIAATGRVVVLSSGEPGRLRGVYATKSGLAFGHALACVGDWNGDGTPDFAASAYSEHGVYDEHGRAMSFVSVLDGRTLDELERFVAPRGSSRFGCALAAWSAPASGGEGRVPRLAIGEAGRVWIVDAKRGIQ